MKDLYVLGLGFALLSSCVSVASVTEEVNCLLGTEGTGHTFPAAAYPFGLVQAGPDTGWGTWEYCSGYQYRDKRITMFSQTHNSGGGCSDYADIGIMPVTGQVSVPVQIAADEKGKASTTSVAREYDKASERAEPGYYAVTLADGIRVEAAASELCAVYRITYPQGVTPRLLVDLDYGMEGNPLIGYGERKRTATKESAWREGELLAHIVKNGFVPDRQIGVAMRFEPKPSAVEELPRQAGDHAPQYVADFNLAADRTLLVRIGLSTASAAGAMRNLERQVGTVGFDDVRRAASEKWEKVLSRIRLEGGDRDTRVNFATAVYRMFLQPQNIADADAPEPYYSEFSLWDTFRGAHPIYTLAAKEYVPKFVNSLIAHQERFGYLPVLPKWGRDTQCMIGTHAVSVIAEAYFKGFEDVDWERAYRAVKDTLTRPHEGRIKENWDLYDRHGYYPFDEIRGESVSRTLECSYDDWCAMKLAESLGHAEDAAFFRRRASCWTNVFDRSIGFVRGRDSQGRWREPFDPYQLGHGADTENDFTEGNAFQYTWHVLQDPEGLMNVMGGRQAFVRKLDELFAAKDKVEGSGCVVDVTGLIGQYAHGNEPSHHIVYLYQYAGRGDRTAEKVREICRKFYRNAPDGLCGNEDHGEMSAWYVFACMGFYPVSPASGEYVLGAPQVPSVCVDVGGGKVFRVVAKGLSEQAKYVKSVSLNGRPLDGFILRHADIENGGELVFEMTDRPTPEDAVIRLSPGDDDTGRIQRGIDTVFRSGRPGVVRLSKGRYDIGSIRLRSNVTLYLESGAELHATREMGRYDILKEDRVEPVELAEFGGEYRKRPEGELTAMNCSMGHVFRNWNRGIIRIFRAHDVAIIGEPGSVIDGRNSYDPEGEEHYRGAHGISANLVTNGVFRGYTLRHAGNWAHRIYLAKNLRFEDIVIRGGHDGIHLKGVENAVIRRCDIHSGDDAIAGYLNRNVIVEDCELASACSVFRFGARGFVARRCRIVPCEWPWRGSLALEDRIAGRSLPGRGRCSTLSFFTYYCDPWTVCPLDGPQGDMVFTDIRIDAEIGVLMHYLYNGTQTWQRHRPLSDVTFRNVTALRLSDPFAFWCDGLDTSVAFEGCRFGFSRTADAFLRANGGGTVLFRDVDVGNLQGPLVRYWNAAPGRVDAENTNGNDGVLEPGAGEFPVRGI